MILVELSKDKYMLYDSSEYIFRSISMVFRALLSHIFTKFTPMSAVYQQFPSSCACCKAESPTSHHDPRRMCASSLIQSGLLETAQHFYSKTYACDYIGFEILFLTLAFFEFSDPIERLASCSPDAICRTPAERASAGWLVSEILTSV
jgi:hypothetical protein